MEKPRFIDHKDGTITDFKTSLIWEQRPSDQRYIWKDTATHIAKLNASMFGGHTDWRLPELWELVSLVDYTQNNPAIDPVFGATAALNYWSATTFANGPFLAWFVYFGSGLVGYDTKGNGYYVRAVRTGSENKEEN